MNKITHLIPATEFILKIGNDENHLSHEERLAVIYNYAIFLSQPLQEWMFVGEDRLFDGFYFEANHLCYEDYFLFGLPFARLKIENIIYSSIEGKAELTPKALEQIYGSI